MKVLDIIKIGHEAEYNGKLPRGNRSNEKAFELGKKVATKAIFSEIIKNNPPWSAAIRRETPSP